MRAVRYLRQGQAKCNENVSKRLTSGNAARKEDARR